MPHQLQCPRRCGLAVFCGGIVVSFRRHHPTHCPKRHCFHYLTWIVLPPKRHLRGEHRRLGTGGVREERVSAAASATLFVRSRAPFDQGIGRKSRAGCVDRRMVGTTGRAGLATMLSRLLIIGGVDHWPIGRRR